MSHRIAGIDVHKRMLAVVVADSTSEGELHFERRKFLSGPGELRKLAQWLDQLQVQEAVMESTAQYWQPGRHWRGSVTSNWRKRSPTVARVGANRISVTPSGW
jgi:hypothetical protein